MVGRNRTQRHSRLVLYSCVLYRSLRACARQPAGCGALRSALPSPNDAFSYMQTRHRRNHDNLFTGCTRPRLQQRLRAACIRSVITWRIQGGMGAARALALFSLPPRLLASLYVIGNVDDNGRTVRIYTIYAVEDIRAPL